MEKRAHITISEMFSQRGYSDIEEGDEHIIAIKHNGEQICAFKNIVEKLNIEQIKFIVQTISDMKINHALVIHEERPTSAVKNFLLDSTNTHLKIELFPIIDLQYNPTKHFLVPEHIPLSGKDASEFRQKFGSKIPILLRTDPISKFFGFEKGSIIKIVRKDGISYRIVK